MNLVSFKATYHIDDVCSKSQLDALFEKFNNPPVDETYELLKVQNTFADKLFPCYVIYLKHHLCLNDYENK